MPIFTPDRFKEDREYTTAQISPAAREARRQQKHKFELEQIRQKGEEELARQQTADEAAMARIKEQLGTQKEIAMGEQGLKARQLEYEYGEGGYKPSTLEIERGKLGQTARHMDILDRLRDIEEKRNEMLYGSPFGEGGIERERIAAQQRGYDILEKRLGLEEAAKNEALRLQQAKLHLEASKATNKYIEDLKMQDPKFKAQWAKMTPEQQRQEWERIRAAHLAEMGLGEEETGNVFSQTGSWRNFAK